MRSPSWLPNPCWLQGLRCPRPHFANCQWEGNLPTAMVLTDAFSSPEASEASDKSTAPWGTGRRWFCLVKPRYCQRLLLHLKQRLCPKHIHLPLPSSFFPKSIFDAWVLVSLANRVGSELLWTVVCGRCGCKGKEGKGRERKGKEGKRLERKGKEGKGLERKGKKGKGRERKGTEGTGRERKGREKEGREREKEGKGLDRKGKEGKGLERKGKKGKGRERKGTEGTRERKGKRTGKGRERKGKKERKGKEGKGRKRKGREGKGMERKGKEGKERERKGKKGKERGRKGKDSLLGYCTPSLNASVQSWKKWNLQWMRP